MIQFKSPHFTLRLIERQKRRKSYAWTIGISRKVIPLATRRNHWKRRIKEVLRRQGVTSTSYQISITVHNASSPPVYHDIQNEIMKLVTESGVMK